MPNFGLSRHFSGVLGGMMSPEMSSGDSLGKGAAFEGVCPKRDI